MGCYRFHLLKVEVESTIPSPMISGIGFLSFLLCFFPWRHTIIDTLDCIHDDIHTIDHQTISKEASHPLKKIILRLGGVPCLDGSIRVPSRFGGYFYDTYRFPATYIVFTFPFGTKVITFHPDRPRVHAQQIVV